MQLAVGKFLCMYVGVRQALRYAVADSIVSCRLFFVFTAERGRLVCGGAPQTGIRARTLQLFVFQCFVNISLFRLLNLS